MHQGRSLVLLRHGQTAWNAERRAQGHSDVDLDDLGRAQAAAVAPYVAALAPTLLWSSDLARASRTAEHVAAAASLELRLDPRLREFDLGERTGTTMDEFAAAHPEEYREFRAGRYDVVPGGESRSEVAARVVACVHEALAALEPGGVGVLVSHGGALKVSVLELLGWPEAAAAGLQALDNCGWAVLSDSGVGGALRLEAWNRRAPDFPPPDFAASPGVG